MGEEGRGPGWFQVQWSVFVHANSPREAWLKAARSIMKRAKAMQEGEVPIVRWTRFDQTPKVQIREAPPPEERD